jgi:hypothetical protein
MKKKKMKKEPAMNPNSSQRRSYADRWKVGFGLNMIVMAVSFALYFLGFFGGVEGPLTMTNIGRGLADLGFTSESFQGLLIAIFILALTWNWVLNLVAHLTGQRLTCTAGSAQEGFCGELVERRRSSGEKVWAYACPHGHARKEAHFHPIRKGRLANSVLAASLVMALMYYLS